MSTTQIFTNGSALYNNGKVAISKDLVFGLSVFTDGGWIPLSDLDKEELDIVRGLLDNDPLFMWGELFQKAYNTPTPVLSISTDGSVATLDMVESGLNSMSCVDSMTAQEYLTHRNEDYSKLLGEKNIDAETGEISFSKDGHVYVVAKPTTGGYLLKCNDRIVYDLKKNREEVYAEVLKRFW